MGAVSELREQPGQDILLYGSADLVRMLTAQGLIDEYRFMIFPLILGTGKRLFGEESAVTLKLVETKTFGSGVVASPTSLSDRHNDSHDQSQPVWLLNTAIQEGANA